MATTKKAHYVADEQYPETETALGGDVQDPEYEEIFSQDDEAALPVVRVLPSPNTFAYDVGHRVQPAPTVPPRTIIWRGHLKQRRSDTGLIHRVNVYRLDDGFWDCYLEDELRAA